MTWSTCGTRPFGLGISGGLANLSALAISTDLESLIHAALEVAGLFFRLCRFTSVRSRAMEDRPGVWGWAILGITPDELAKVLDQIQHNMVSDSTEAVKNSHREADLLFGRGSLPSKGQRSG